MASVLDRYGIKEVADLTFYENVNDERGVPVLYIDTAKVSTIEQTAENVSARGGKGNPELITWDYGKEITLSIEDALYSAKSLAIQFGGGKVSGLGGNEKIYKTFSKANLDSDSTKASIKATNNGVTVTLSNPKFYTVSENGTTEVTDKVTDIKEGAYDYVTGEVTASSNFVIDVSANAFPGTYYITGDTYARNEFGQDEFFQFIVPKGKVLAESNTLTLEAEGDPTVFSMNVKVLRPADGVMMKLIQYTVSKPTANEGTGV